MSLLTLSSRWILFPLLFASSLSAREDGWSGSANVGVTLATGNSESLRTTAGLEATRRFGPWEALGEASAIYGEDDGIRSNEQFEALLQLNRDLTEKIYAGLGSAFLYDPIAGVDYRFEVTPLLGFRVLDNERVTLNLEAGPGYVWEERGGSERSYTSLRLHEAFTYRFTEDTKFFQSLTAVFEAADLNNHVLTAKAGVESRIVGQWSLRVAGKAIRYGEARGRDRDDLLVTAGFGYNYLPANNKATGLAEAHGERESEMGEWVVTALLGGSLSEGNSEARSVNAGLEIAREREHDEFGAGAFASYGERNGLVSTEAYSAEAHYQRTFADRWFAGVRVDAAHDAPADLEWRLALSPYLGRKLIVTETTKLSVEAGPSLVFEQQGGEEDTFFGAYAALRGEQRIGPSTRLYGDLSLTTEVGEWSSYLLTGEAGLDQSLTDKISLKLITRSTYDSTPAAGRQRHDLQLISALGVSF